MASSLSADSAPTDNTPTANPENDSQKLVLHVLCPSLPGRNKFTFDDLTPSTTVATLKIRISESLPNRPSTAIQRLIYCGKPIANDDLALKTVLEPVEVCVLPAREWNTDVWSQPSIQYT